MVSLRGFVERLPDSPLRMEEQVLLTTEVRIGRACLPW
jgi:hypothetical protein